MTRHDFLTLATLLALAPATHAQVRVEFEQAHGGDGYAVHDAVAHPAGGFVLAGAVEHLLPNNPSPTYIPRTPFVLRLDAASDVVWQHTIPVGFTFLPEPVIAAVDALGRAVLAFPLSSVELRGFAPDGTPTFSTAIPGAGDLVPGGLRSAPWGDFTVVLRVAGNGIVVAGFDATGAPRFTTAPMAPASPSAVATIAESGRAATHTNTTVFVVEADGSPGWSAPIPFAPRALAFGPAGELAIAGHDGTNPWLRVHETNGAVRFTRTDPQAASGGWNGVTIDRFGRVAAAGSFGGGDAADALVALFAADGSTAFVRAWAGSAGFADGFLRILVTASGDVIAGGRTDLNSSMQYWTNQRRLVVAAFDPAGVERWQHVDAEGGTNTEVCARLLEAGDGKIVSAGTRYAQNFVNAGYRPLAAHVLGLRRQSSGFCYGDSQSAACPCGNQSAPGAQRGCANSSGPGARLVDSGVASVSNDTLVLTVDGTTPSAPGLYFQGSLAITPVAFGDGLRCAGGTLVRLYTRAASGGTSSVPSPGDPSVSARSATAGDALAPGSTRVYQVQHRDLAPAFCPVATSNASSALAIVWGA